MLAKSKSNRSLLAHKDCSLQQLHKLNSFLDGQQHQTKYINKEIKKEIQMAKKNEQQINRTIHEISSNGEGLVRKYEEEKQKSEKLEFLVKHFENQIYKAKLDKANDLKNNIQTDKLVQLTTILNQKEKDLEKICEKSNTSSYDLSKKVDTIRALRSERTIISDLFDKIERQLCSLEHCYKVLVIQRKKEEDQWEHVVNEFNKCQVTGNREITKLKEKNVKLKEKSLVQPVSKARLNTEPEFVQNKRMSVLSALGEELTNHRQSKLSQFFRQKEKAKPSKYEGDILRIEKERKVKLILNTFGISSVKQLPEQIYVLEANNQSLLQQSDRIFDQIVQAEKNLKKLQDKKVKSLRGVSEKQTVIQQKKQQISLSLDEIRKNRLQLSEFKEGCKIIINRLREGQQQQTNQPDFLNDEEQIVFYMAELEKYFQKSYTEKTIIKPKRQRAELKRLTYLLNASNDPNNLSIYQEKDLLQFAKKNLSKLDKPQKIGNSRVQR